MRILIGVDGSEAAEVACRFVASRTWPAGTTVELVAAYETPTDWTGLVPSSSRAEEAVEEATSLLLERAGPLRLAGLTVLRSVEPGRPADALIRRAGDELADLIVVGNRGLGPIASVVLGSVSAHLVDHAPCPVLVVRSPGASRMLLATDGTDSSRNIPHILDTWGPAFRSLPVEVLSVAAREALLLAPIGAFGEPPAELPRNVDYAAHEQIAEQVADEMMDLGWHAAAVVRAGLPEREIIAAAEAWKADLIVTGSRGLGTFRRLLQGSLSHDLLMHSHSSLLVMRGHVPARIRQREALRGMAPA